MGSRRRGPRARYRDPETRSARLWASVIPIACVSRPGPLPRLRAAAVRRRRRIRSNPATGSMARSSTAPGRPRGSVTTFMQAWVP